MQPLELHEKELKQIVTRIGMPVFKYMVRRIQREFADNPTYLGMSLNTFLTLVCATMAVNDANMLRWASNIYKTQTGEDLEDEKLRNAFIRNLYEQLGITVQ